jgi:hypothetical protein
VSAAKREDAEDTVQEVLLKSVPHLPKFDSPKVLNSGDEKGTIRSAVRLLRISNDVRRHRLI